MQHNISIFEKNPKKTQFFLLAFSVMLFYGLISVKFINNAHTEFERKSIKTIVHQYWVGQIIDKNIGRFIKLREQVPGQVRFERPTRNYLKNTASHSLERKYYRVATDKDGFIEPSAVHNAPDFKIVFLGGSTTECLYMEEEQRFPYLVGRHLEKALGKKVNTYNGGVSANESMHSINILLNKVLTMQPDVVLMMHNINDLAILRSQGSYWYPNSLKSHLQTSKNVFTRFQFPENPHPFDEQKIKTAFRRNLLTFIAICRIHDIQPVLMTQANRVRDDKLYHHFNDIIQSVGLQENVRVVDLAKTIPATGEYLHDDYHYTSKGSALASSVIAKQLQPIIQANK